ncbi:DNA (cytosine-5-)-methyltransferase [Romboutsia lituseburensis]|uniref:Cytosine-specific methyltransferase n=1 Tax=Romboutsia lituseburensis DSM 797 TaxID=1121325 RepID=A0A1G9I8X0_9FIRM|nr:DNA (cytosine-5-)-methyltransferase [Romboutsia lituseburensis]CEH33995.1 Modification methylase Sau3AI [Romboutsia lituseburensis]SDL21688.1 DNA (cytosine-5)-methyltransferase 1 [Romboutsia lituseburensis DSM 797]
MIKVCELFAGVGGFRLGLESASDEFKFVWANQWEPSKKVQHAFDCYVSHFGVENHVNTDISLVDKNQIPNHDLLVGGFPCQDYSVARTGAKGIQGVKGVLWWQIRDILEAKKPRFVLLENVDRLLKSPAKQRGRDFGVMLACFNDLGYSVEWRVINAAEYGFSQRRRRIFIFAFKSDTDYAKDINRENLREWIHDTGFFQKEFPIHEIKDVNGNNLISSFEDKVVEYKQEVMEYNDIVDISDNFKLEFENAGIMSNGKIYTEKTFPKYNGTFTLLKDILETDVDEKYYLDGDEAKLAKWEYLKGAKKIERTSKTGHNYIFSEGPLAFPDPIDRPARTMLTSESSVNRSTHVVRDPQTDRLRLITPMEAERLNGFKDNWTNSGMPEKFRYFCMGNALVVSLVKKMGNAIKSIVDNEEQASAYGEVAITK